MTWNARAKRRLIEAHDWWSTKDTVSQLYLSALVMTLIAILLIRWQPEDPTAQLLTGVAFSLFAIGYLWEAYIWIVPKLELPLAKLILATLGVVAAATATGVSRMIVNEATGQDPAYFGTTVALLMPMSFVPVVAAMVLIGGIIILPATMFWMLLQSFGSRATNTDLILLFGCARAFGVLVIVGFATAVLKPSSPLFPALGWLASFSAHAFDTHLNSACAFEQGDRVLRISDDLIILSRMTSDGPQFIRRSCPLAAENTPLLPNASSTRR